MSGDTSSSSAASSTNLDSVFAAHPAAAAQEHITTVKYSSTCRMQCEWYLSVHAGEHTYGARLHSFALAEVDAATNQLVQ